MLDSKTVMTFIRKEPHYTFGVVCSFILVSLIGILNHEMWLDELQAWLIARDSTSLVNLFQNLRYEGHPGLWHLGLYLISRFTQNPIAMQFFHLSIATASVYIFVRFSHFTKLQKILFSFGYFPFYEYNIISRNYSLGLLLVFLFCVLFPKRTNHYWLLAIILALLANTNIYSFIISICLFLTLIIDYFYNKNLLKVFVPQSKRTLLSFALVIAGYIVALIQVIPPEDAKFTGSAKLFTESNVLVNNIKHLAYVLMTVWRSYVPIPNIFDFHFWNNNLLIEGAGTFRVFALFLSLSLIIFSLAIFIQKPIILFLYTSGTLGILLFAHIKFLGYLRHHGHLFILFIVCLWLASYYPRQYFFNSGINKLSKLFTKYKQPVIMIILYIHVVASMFTYTMDLLYPFSASKEVAQIIKSQELDQYLISGSKDYAVAPLAALLNQKIYYLESDRLGSFINWNQRENIDEAEFVRRLENVVQKNTTVLVLNHELYNKVYKLLNVSQIFKTNKSIVQGEDYYLYLVERK